MAKATPKTAHFGRYQIVNLKTNTMKIKRKFKSVTYRVDQDTYDRILILSKDERRSATSLIEWLVD